MITSRSTVLAHDDAVMACKGWGEKFEPDAFQPLFVAKGHHENECPV
jgi:hypothetical protein